MATAVNQEIDQKLQDIYQIRYLVVVYSIVIVPMQSEIYSYLFGRISLDRIMILGNYGDFWKNFTLFREMKEYIFVFLYP